MFHIDIFTGIVFGSVTGNVLRNRVLILRSASKSTLMQYLIIYNPFIRATISQIISLLDPLEKISSILRYSPLVDHVRKRHKKHWNSYFHTLFFKFFHDLRC